MAGFVLGHIRLEGFEAMAAAALRMGEAIRKMSVSMEKFCRKLKRTRTRRSREKQQTLKRKRKYIHR